MSSDSKRFGNLINQYIQVCESWQICITSFVAHGLLIKKYSGTSETCITTLHINFLTVNCSLYVSSPYGFYTSYVDTMT